MRIGLHDSDATGFPNLALMKLSAWHKAQGDSVEWWNPLVTYDRVYFTFCERITANNEIQPRIRDSLPRFAAISICAHSLFSSDRLAKTFSILTVALRRVSSLRCV